MQQAFHLLPAPLSTYNIYSLTKLPAYSTLSHSKSHFFGFIILYDHNFALSDPYSMISPLSHHGLLDVADSSFLELPFLFLLSAYLMSSRLAHLVAV